MPGLLVASNMLLFSGLAWYSVRSAMRARSPGVRQLWILAALPMIAVVLGGTLRLGLQAFRLGFLPEDSVESLLYQWQIAQSLLVAGIGIATFLGIHKVAARFSDVDVIVGEMIDRVRSVDVDSLGLTAREREVLALIGASAVIDDRNLADELGVSSDTAHTHVTSLMKKTKLRSRRDLQAVAFLVKGPRN